MKDKLEVGMYVRTNDGYIAKLVEIKKQDHRIQADYIFDSAVHDIRGYELDECILWECELSDITREPVFDIKELIEIGDYINGICIYSIDKFEDGSISFNGEPINFCGVSEIVTKERFKKETYHINKGE